MSTTENVIEIKNLGFSYENTWVLDHIDMKINRGDYVGIIGSNGAGKSTLLKLILGLLKPVSGTISLLGKDNPNPKDFCKIGYVPQNCTARAAGFPATAEEIVKASLFSQIGFLRFCNRKYMPQVEHALETVGMNDYAKRMIGEMSGGQQQRVMIARVLVSNPEILLLDEPTTGIDADAAEGLYDLLEKLNKEKNMTVLMVTHDIERASKSVKRLLRLNHNGILEE